MKKYGHLMIKEPLKEDDVIHGANPSCTDAIGEVQSNLCGVCQQWFHWKMTAYFVKKETQPTWEEPFEYEVLSRSKIASLLANFEKRNASERFSEAAPAVLCCC